MEFQSEANLSLKLLSQYIRFSNRNLFAVEANYFQQRQILKFSALHSLKGCVMDCALLHSTICAKKILILEIGTLSLYE